jgi:hypothetical protein
MSGHESQEEKEGDTHHSDQENNQVPALVKASTTWEGFFVWMESVLLSFS